MDAKELSEQLHKINEVVESALDNESQERWEEAWKLAEGLQNELVSAELIVEYCATHRCYTVR